jgi:hypothetical protein
MKKFTAEKIIINNTDNNINDISKLNIFNFDKEISEENKKIIDIYIAKIQLYSNLYLNKINFYKEALLTIDNLNLENKITILMKHTENIDNNLKKIEEKKKIILKKYEIVKKILAKVFEENKNVFLSKNNLKIYLRNGITIVENLKIEMSKIGDYLRKLNSIKENLIIQKFSFIEKDNLSKDLSRNSFKLTKIIQTDFTKFLEINKNLK